MDDLTANQNPTVPDPTSSATPGTIPSLSTPPASSAGPADQTPPIVTPSPTLGSTDQSSLGGVSLPTDQSGQSLPPAPQPAETLPTTLPASPTSTEPVSPASSPVPQTGPAEPPQVEISDIKSSFDPPADPSQDSFVPASPLPTDPISGQMSSTGSELPNNPFPLSSDPAQSQPSMTNQPSLPPLDPNSNTNQDQTAANPSFIPPTSSPVPQTGPADQPISTSPSGPTPSQQADSSQMAGIELFPPAPQSLSDMPTSGNQPSFGNEPAANPVTGFNVSASPMATTEPTSMPAFASPVPDQTSSANPGSESSLNQPNFTPSSAPADPPNLPTLTAPSMPPTDSVPQTGPADPPSIENVGGGNLFSKVKKLFGGNT